jgi:hypothetical protein
MSLLRLQSTTVQSNHTGRPAGSLSYPACLEYVHVGIVGRQHEKQRSGVGLGIGEEGACIAGGERRAGRALKKEVQNRITGIQY